VFVQHGVTFADFHSESPLCCPARAGYLTGQHSHNHGVVLNKAQLFNPRMSIATQLHALGYHTALAGKYLNMYGTCKKNAANCAPTIPAGWDRWDALGDQAYYSYTLWSGDAGAPATPQAHGTAPEDYSTDVIARAAERQIADAPPSQPLFEWVAVFGPHAPMTPAPRHAGSSCPVQPWDPPSFNEADVSDKPAYVRGTPLLTGAKARGHTLTAECRALRSVDEAVAGVRDALAATGRLDDTLFVFAGDNGMEEGEHRLSRKEAPYITQIPFLISWPAGLGSEPRTVSERVQNIDLAPTLCALAGCALGPYPNGQARPDGISFLPLLEGQDSLGRDAVLDEMPAVQSAKVTNAPPPWAAVTTTASSPLAAVGCALAATGGCRWHYIEYVTGERELYDVSGGPCWSWLSSLSGDPCELQNRAGDPALADVQAVLQTRLHQLQAERGQPVSP
jgi:arylsulfatase A-like enzyme